MQTITQKAITGIISLAAIILVSGTIVLAQDQASGNVIVADDLSFIEAQPTGTVTKVAHRTSEAGGGLVTSADHAFAARPFSDTVGNRQVAADHPQTAGIITAADYQFVTKGHSRDVFATDSDFADAMAERLAK